MTKYLVPDEATIRELAEIARTIPTKEPVNSGPTTDGFNGAITRIGNQDPTLLSCYPDPEDSGRNNIHLS